MSGYHDYVIKDGKLIGKFEEMYQVSSEVPWHQDETAFEIFSDIDITVLKYFRRKYGFESVAEVGCGLGYVAERLRTELAEQGVLSITGLDISSTAVSKATAMFPNIHFECRDILRDNFDDMRGRYDLVMAKETIWYVLDDIETYFAKLIEMSKRFVYIAQSFPDKKPFLGSDIFPDARALENFISTKVEIIHSTIEKDIRYGNRELIHVFAKRN